VLRISVLGELRIECDGAPVAPLESRRARLLLGWLALNPGRHARGELAARLRPDVLDESARSSLRQAAWALRPALGGALEATRGEVGLADDVWVDAREFGRLAGSAPEEALALVRGPLLKGLDDEWVLHAREIQLAAEDALLERMESAAGDPGTALTVARRRAARDPLSEEAHRALMTRQAEAGDRAAALLTYERLAERLRRELGVAPSSVTRELATALREDEAPARALPPRLAAANRAPFVGRGAELTRALAAWREARGGSLRAVLLGGEPGIGKTRLAAEVADRAYEEGAAVIHGRCSEEQLAPHQPWVEALEQVGIAFEPAAEGTRLELFQSVVRRLAAAAARGPLVVVLDDLHWADPPTLLLLVHLVSAAPQVPLLVIATYRDTEAGPSLQRALADLRREPGVDRVRLRGMGDRDVAALVEVMAGGARGDAFERAVSEETGGSPFFVGELIRHLEETGRPLAAESLADAGLPEGVGEVLDRRLERLGDESRRALAVAAVAGLEFRVDVVAAAAGVEAPRLTEMLDVVVAAGLAIEPPGAPARYAFPHALVREALYRRLGAGRRARLHADVGHALEVLTLDPAGDAAALAHHFAAAGLGAEALLHGEVAARRAMDMLAWEDAAGHVERALRTASPRELEPGHRSRLLLLLGEARGRAGAVEQAGQAFAEVVAVARQLGSGELLAQAALGAGGVGVTIVEVDTDLVALLEEALAALGDTNPGLRARLLSRLATELYYTGESGRDRGRALTADAVAMARRGEDVETLAETLAGRRVALWDPRHLEARLEVDAELIELGARHREAELRGRHWRFVDLAELGDMTEARAELDRYEALANELRMPAFTWYVPLWRAALAIFEGRYDEGQMLADEALAAGRRAEDANAEIFHVIQSGAIFIDQERFAEFPVPATVYERLESAEASVAWMTGMAWGMAVTDRPDEAQELLARVCDDELAALPWDANRPACLAELAEAACALGELGFAAAIERALEPWADRNLANARAISFYGSGHYFLGKLAAARGDRDTAARRFEVAIRRNAEYGAAPRSAMARRELDRLTSLTAR
jgi:DNA-binding SARP family transcriptional activator/tetratricopeptide (TPR) repeat protein